MHASRALWQRTAVMGSLLALTVACAAGVSGGRPETSLPEKPYSGPSLGSPKPHDVPCEAAQGATKHAELPAMTLDCLGPGPALRIDELGGRPTLVNLWATWCGPCRREMPMLAAVDADLDDRLRFIGVDTKDNPEAAAKFLDETGVRYEQLYDPDGELLTRLKVPPGLPITLLLDDSGQVVWRHIGEVEEDQLRDQLADVT